MKARPARFSWWDFGLISKQRDRRDNVAPLGKEIRMSAKRSFLCAGKWGQVAKAMQ
jgi:hypothetical protein